MSQQDQLNQLLESALALSETQDEHRVPAGEPEALFDERHDFDDESAWTDYTDDFR